MNVAGYLLLKGWQDLFCMWGMLVLTQVPLLEKEKCVKMSKVKHVKCKKIKPKSTCVVKVKLYVVDARFCDAW